MLSKTRAAWRTPGLALLLLWSNSLFALDVNIAPDTPYVETAHEGKPFRIQRIQDQNHVLTGGFTKTSRKCPPFCIQPLHVAPGVITVGELEFLDFIEKKLNTGQGVVIDARTPSWHEKGTIPGSINIPFTSFDKETNEAVKAVALGKLGVIKKTGTSMITSLWESALKLVGSKTAGSPWDFTNAKEILLWCNGMWCGQSPRAIHNLLALGYPAEKIYYYRGGMQSWQILGLSVVVPNKQ
ncbi:MAG: rhodanese-like domain-containing protein [Gammaproteobacteria bacterium]|jgi:rhodanese-related sulfurtransferase|nr:rhodanese-like domain-containing protein [Gammaproteobacteria bacterium]